jgi:hypothetical protein
MKGDPGNAPGSNCGTVALRYASWRAVENNEEKRNSSPHTVLCSKDGSQASSRARTEEGRICVPA